MKKCVVTIRRNKSDDKQSETFIGWCDRETTTAYGVKLSKDQTSRSEMFAKHSKCVKATLVEGEE